MRLDRRKPARVDVGTVVEQFAEGLDTGDLPGDRIATTERLLINVDNGLPGGAGELAEKAPVVAWSKFAAAWES